MILAVVTIFATILLTGGGVAFVILSRQDYNQNNMTNTLAPSVAPSFDLFSSDCASNVGTTSGEHMLIVMSTDNTFQE